MPQSTEAVNTTPATGVTEAVEQPGVQEEVLVEEVSIDGMCGVY